MSTQIPRGKAVFVEALEIAAPKQRRQFLDQACGADQAWREQVERLLRFSQSAGEGGFVKIFGESALRLSHISSMVQ